MLCLEAHAKINWTLDILGKREDGYHLMDMLMQSISLSDTLWLEPANELALEGRPDEAAASKKRMATPARLKAPPCAMTSQTLCIAPPCCSRSDMACAREPACV